MQRLDHDTVPRPSDGRGIVLSEAYSGGPSKGDYESMARRRYQKPAPRIEGRQWVIYYWDDKQETFYMLLAYAKSKQEDLTPTQMKVLTKLVREELK